MNNLEIPQLINKNNLDQANYFQSMLQEAFRLNLLTESELENIQQQSIQLLVRQSERYTAGDSSLKIETAQGIMESILFTIGVYLKSFPGQTISLSIVKQKPLSEMYRQGKSLIKAQLNVARKLFSAVQNNSISTDNCAYNDTIQNGIPGFFASYDADFAAHDTPASIDYPLSNDKIELVGIEYIYNYLQKLYLENQFCKIFAEQDVHCLLRGYDDHYQDLLINIFELLLTNAAGCILANKNILQLNIEPSDLRYLQLKLANLPKDKLDGRLLDASEHIWKEFNISDVLLQKHVTANVMNLSPKLTSALENNLLESIFVSLKENHPQPFYQFEDGEKMDDELFRIITGEIRECRHVSDKILIIQREVHSITDLVDILEGYCIFDDEFSEIFQSLGDMELALLLKRLPTHVIDLDYHLTENEKEWHNQLNCFFEKVDLTRRKKIRDLAQNTRLSLDEYE